MSKPLVCEETILKHMEIYKIKILLTLHYCGGGGGGGGMGRVEGTGLGGLVEANNGLDGGRSGAVRVGRSGMESKPNKSSVRGRGARSTTGGGGSLEGKLFKNASNSSSSPFGPCSSIT